MKLFHVIGVSFERSFIMSIKLGIPVRQHCYSERGEVTELRDRE